MVSMNPPRGTEPSGRHPPLIRQPKAPLRLSSVHNSSSFSGVVAEYMVFRTFPLQCLHFNAQLVPVTEIVGKSVSEEW